LQAGRLGHEQGEDLTAAIHDCEQALAHARDDARALSKATGDAQNAINAVYGPISPALGEAPLSQPEVIEPKGQEHAPGAAADLAAEDFPLPITDALQAAPGSDPAPGGPAPALPARTAKKGV